MTQYIFFSGKGGVGKTTMACATAVNHATQGKKTLIVTTDPASNLSDVFEQPIGHQIVPIAGVDHLFAMEIDPDEATREYRERIISPFKGFMPQDIIASLEEQFNSPCTTEIASFDRFVDFMDTDQFDVIIFDTAPTGHTVRLLELPVDWSKHIEESAKGGGQTCLGPVQAIQSSKEKYDRATALLRDTSRTTFVFVMRPEELSLYETIRASKELAHIGISAGHIIMNGILPLAACDIDFFRKKHELQQRVVQKASDVLPGTKSFMFLRDNEIKGIDALISVAKELFHGELPPADGESGNLGCDDINIPKPDINFMFAPRNNKRMVFFTGKGGVGKTTISCITAVYMAEQGYKTLVVTTDPAGHIGEVLDQKVTSEPVQITDMLYAVMIDPKEAFTEYKARILADAKGKYSEEMLTVMEEELNSPCTEEMAAFDRFTQFIENDEFEVIVFDTAPTGHTLRLLDLPFDYAKQIEMMVSLDEQGVATKQASRDRYRQIIDRLRDPEQACFSLVLYPESTPIIESYRAMIDLQEAGIQTQLVVANMILPQEVCTNSFFTKRRHMQTRYLANIQERFGTPVTLYPLLENDIKGLASLREAAKQLQ